MLKLILLDVNPYLIDGKIINDSTWKILQEKNIIDGYINTYSDLEPLLRKNKSIFNFQNDYLSIIDVKIYDSLVQEWNKIYSSVLNEYIIKKEVNQTIFKLLKDAENNNIKIVFVTNNCNFVNLGQMFSVTYKEKGIDILKLSNFNILKTDFVINYASNFGIGYDEVVVVTQQTETIQDLIENKIFTITINGKNKMISTNFLSLENNESINIDQILYFFHEYEKNNKTSI